MSFVISCRRFFSAVTTDSLALTMTAPRSLAVCHHAGNVQSFQPVAAERRGKIKRGRHTDGSIVTSRPAASDVRFARGQRSSGTPAARLFFRHGLAAPVDEVGYRRLAARSADQHGNLPAMIPRVAEQLVQNLLDAVAKPSGVEALVFEDAAKLVVAQATEIGVPMPLDILQVQSRLGEADVVGEKRCWSVRQNAEPKKPDAPGGGDVRQQRDGAAELGCGAAVYWYGFQRANHLRMGVFFILEPAAITSYRLRRHVQTPSSAFRDL